MLRNWRKLDAHHLDSPRASRRVRDARDYEKALRLVYDQSRSRMRCAPIGRRSREPDFMSWMTCLQVHRPRRALGWSTAEVQKALNAMRGHNRQKVLQTFTGVGRGCWAITY